MGYLKLYEQFRLIRESVNNLPCILIDGTSSAGKSFLSSSLLEEKWVIIALDDFKGSTQSSLMRFPFDHEGEGPNLKAAFEWHESILIDGSGNPSNRAKSGFDFLETSVGWGKHPHKQDLRGAKSDEASWYMYQDYLHGRGTDINFYYNLYSKNAEIAKKLKEKGFDTEVFKPGAFTAPTGVIFDDLNDQMKNYLPELKHVVLYAPLEVLDRNRKFRKLSDPRPTDLILNQFTEKYKAVKQKSKLDPVEKGYTKKLILKLFDGDAYLETFCEKMKIEEDKEYWFELKDQELLKNVLSLRKENKLYIKENGDWDFDSIKNGFKNQDNFSKELKSRF
jgi:hypothetical protein